MNCYILVSAYDLFGCLLVYVFDSVIDYSVKTIVLVLSPLTFIYCWLDPLVYLFTYSGVLSSLTECNLQHYAESAVMRVGVEMSDNERVRVMEACADILGKLNAGAVFICVFYICFMWCDVCWLGCVWKFEGTGKCELVYGVVRVAVMMSKVRYTMQLAPVIDVKTTDGRSRVLKKLVDYVPKGIEYVNEKLPLRCVLL